MSFLSQFFLFLILSAGSEASPVFAGEAFLELEEVTIERDVPLNLEAFKSIRIKKLIAKQGGKIRISSPSSGEDGQASADGGDGANLLFFVDQLEGHVVLEARGGDGGDGVDGRHGQRGVKGKKGRNAFRILWFYLGNGEQGQTGGPGEDGEDGFDGGNGGDGGQVKVYLRNKTPGSNIYVDVSGGKAGLGGKAGHGGLGGKGGKGGKGIKRGPQGKMGSHGNEGRPGRPGYPGKPGSVSIYEVNARYYLCLLDLHTLNLTKEEWQECLYSN